MGCLLSNYNCIHLQNPDFGVLQKTAKNYIILIFLQPRESVPLTHAPTTRECSPHTRTNHGRVFPSHTHKPRESVPLTHAPTTGECSPHTRTNHERVFPSHTHQPRESVPLTHAPPARHFSLVSDKSAAFHQNLDPSTVLDFYYYLIPGSEYCIRCYYYLIPGSEYCIRCYYYLIPGSEYCIRCYYYLIPGSEYCIRCYYYLIPGSEYCIRCYYYLDMNFNLFGILYLYLFQTN